jgi:hypothetical protein
MAAAKSANAKGGTLPFPASPYVPRESNAATVISTRYVVAMIEHT